MTAIENESIENLLHEFHPQKSNTVARRMSFINYRHDAVAGSASNIALKNDVVQLILKMSIKRNNIKIKLLI